MTLLAVYGLLRILFSVLPPAANVHASLVSWTDSLLALFCLAMHWCTATTQTPVSLSILGSLLILLDNMDDSDTLSQMLHNVHKLPCIRLFGLSLLTLDSLLVLEAFLSLGLSLLLDILAADNTASSLNKSTANITLNGITHQSRN